MMVGFIRNLQLRIPVNPTEGTDVMATGLPL
jgi:hypothetical protein